jgi:hypothetical protein
MIDLISSKMKLEFLRVTQFLPQAFLIEVYLHPHLIDPKN